MIRLYVKLPVEVQAVQWTGENQKEIRDFVGCDCCWVYNKLIIHTLEGDHHASIGDYIIRGVNGEFYPCKPDIFEKTYMEVEDINKQIDNQTYLYSFDLGKESGLIAG